MNDNYKNTVLVLLFIMGIVFCLKPLFPEEQLLQQAGTLLLLGVLFINRKSDKIGRFSFTCIALFTLLHIIAARYLYSYVPYNEWIRHATGFDLNSFFHFSRNHFDRLVHFAYGLLAIPVFYEIFDAKLKSAKRYGLLFSWLLVQTTSMLYELFEWSLTLVMSGESADYYNGQQGDMWDAQKDMTFALLGSLVMIVFLLVNKSALQTLSRKTTN